MSACECISKCLLQSCNEAGKLNVVLVFVIRRWFRVLNLWQHFILRANNGEQKKLSRNFDFSNFSPFPSYCFCFIFLCDFFLKITFTRLHNEFIDFYHLSCFMKNEIVSHWLVTRFCYYVCIFLIVFVKKNLIQMESVSSCCKKNLYFFQKCFSDFQEFSFCELCVYWILWRSFRKATCQKHTVMNFIFSSIFLSLVLKKNTSY